MSNLDRPKARLADLMVERVADELLVLDQANALGHCLNRTAAAILEKCDGTRGEEDIRQLVEVELGCSVSPVVVAYALQEMRLKRLVETPPQASKDESGQPGGAKEPTRIRRRDLMRQLGATAALILPAVTTVLVPTPAMAQSAVAAAPAAAPVGAPPAGILPIGPGAPAGAVVVATP